MKEISSYLITFKVVVEAETQAEAVAEARRIIDNPSFAPTFVTWEPVT